MATQKILINQFETPLGTLTAGATPDGICLLEFDDPKRLKREIEALCKLLDAEISDGSNKHLQKLKKQLSEYFAKKRISFDIPLVFAGTDFQKAVWQELLTIPYGSPRSYKQQSLVLHNPEAIRAIAHANGMNRISILIPCHRVIGENGSLTGYGGGLWRKKWLLDHESSQGVMEF